MFIILKRNGVLITNERIQDVLVLLKNGVSQRTAAEKAGVSHDMVKRIALGKLSPQRKGREREFCCLPADFMSYSEKIQTAIDQLEALRGLPFEERKVRLAELKEHFRLIGLYNVAASTDGDETGNAADSEELAAVREHLEPLGLAPLAEKSLKLHLMDEVMYGLRNYLTSKQTKQIEVSK